MLGIWGGHSHNEMACKGSTRTVVICLCISTHHLIGEGTEKKYIDESVINEMRTLLTYG
jgi:hypothetical protein